MTEVHIKIPLALSPDERSKQFGNPLAKALPRSIGKVVGSGTCFNPDNTIDYIGLDVELKSSGKLLKLRTLLRQLNFPVQTEVLYLKEEPYAGATAPHIMVDTLEHYGWVVGVSGGEA